MNDIRHRVGIRAPIRSIYEAVHHPDLITGWWATTASGECDLGSRFQLFFPGYPDQEWEIAELSCDRRVRLVLVSGSEPWLGSELIFELLDVDNQVFVTLTHRTGSNTPQEAVQYFSTKWPAFLVSLKAFLETGNGMPYPNDIRIQHD
jgi:uncharacterized protein YndB with AHSA1/START domain